MALPAADVDTILNTGGMIRFLLPNPHRLPDRGGIPTELVNKVGPSFYPCNATINRPGNVIDLRATSSASEDGDAVNVVYEGTWAKFGDLMSPGYMYSDSFAGCEFFLYRGVCGAVTGVHASKESGKVIDPRDYFRRRGVANPIWHWQSVGKISDTNLMAGWFGAVFLVVDVDRIDCYALALKNQQVMAVIEHTQYTNWRS